MELTIEYWHWFVFGIALILAELVVPSFTIFWFGLGAIATAGLLLLFPHFPFGNQILFWTASSVFFTFLWFKYLKRLLPDRTKAGIAREAILGERGQVIKAPFENEKGVVRFAVPLLGSDEWQFRCNEPVAPGDRVFVTDISGNTLVVKKNLDS